MAPGSLPLAPRSQPGGFYQDGCRGVVAEGEATAVDHANKGAVAADFGDKGSFAKAHLANTLAKGCLAGERAHATRAAGG